MAPMTGSAYCWSHDPANAGARSASARRGGAATRVVPNAPVAVSLATLDDIRSHLEQALADALQHDNTLKRTSAVVRVAAEAMRLHERAEVLELFAALDARLQRLEAQR
jgi:ABC-type phosphate/phosphonate transport system substrate-binding protein